jgi:hypothetical protein
MLAKGGNPLPDAVDLLADAVAQRLDALHRLAAKLGAALLALLQLGRDLVANALDVGLECLAVAKLDEGTDALGVSAGPTASVARTLSRMESDLVEHLALFLADKRVPIRSFTDLGESVITEPGKVLQGLAACDVRARDRELKRLVASLAPRFYNGRDKALR